MLVRLAGAEKNTRIIWSMNNVRAREGDTYPFCSISYVIIRWGND